MVRATRRSRANHSLLRGSIGSNELEASDRLISNCASPFLSERAAETTEISGLPAYLERNFFARSGIASTRTSLSGRCNWRKASVKDPRLAPPSITKRYSSRGRWRRFRKARRYFLSRSDLTCRPKRATKPPLGSLQVFGPVGGIILTSCQQAPV